MGPESFYVQCISLTFSQGQNVFVYSFQTICLKPLCVQCIGGFSVNGGINL